MNLDNPTTAPTTALIMFPLICLGLCLGMVWGTMIYENRHSLLRWWKKRKKAKHKKKTKLRLVVNNQDQGPFRKE